MTEPKPLNAVDLLVRENMLIYPSLYGTRNDVVKGFFLGTNYEWTKSGCLRPVFSPEKDFEGPIDISDLARSDERWTSDDEFAVFVRIQNEAERSKRLFRAEHIDLYAKMSSKDYGYQDLDYWYLDNDSSCLFTAPFGKINKDWAIAMERFISDMMTAFNRVYSLHFDKPLRDEKMPEPSMFSRMPEQMQKRYTRLVEVSAKLEAQTGHRAAQKKFWDERGSAMLSEIKKES